MAIAGGVAVSPNQGIGSLTHAGDVMSNDGKIRTFDRKASGTIFGSGLAAVVLRRLEDALRDGDHIRAVIKGSAVTNDGADRIGFTAPGADGQQRVVRNALMSAGVDPRTITFVEAHGTGTPMGDPIEVGALTRVYRESTDAIGYCGLGSVKPNVGHLSTASGAVGVIKAAKALGQRKLPPTLHFESPNPQLGLDKSPFFVSDQIVPLERGETPLRAGVSAFGIGGTNAHVVLEEAPHREPLPSRRSQHLLPLSARQPEILEHMAERLAARLRAHPEDSLADIAFTLQTGRRRFERRGFVVASTSEAAAKELEAGNATRARDLSTSEQDRDTVFLFSGQGAQYAGMGAALYRSEPTFGHWIDQAAEWLEKPLGVDLRTVLFPAPPARAAAQERLSQTAMTQPALFAIEYALARLWMSWGVEPTAMIGHSIGEYAAAALAGVFSFERALEVVAERGRLMQSLPRGAMLAVALDEQEVLDHLDPALSIAALNAPGRTVISGPTESIDALATRLESAGTVARRLVTSHAFHSPMMEPILDDFIKVIERAAPQEPARSFVSNVSGTWITPEQASDPDYWALHLRSAVRFADGLKTLTTKGDPALLEVGPGTTLVSLARQHRALPKGTTIVASLPHVKDQTPADAAVHDALGKLWKAGVGIDWAGYHDEARRRVPLPQYPFVGKRYWVEEPVVAAPGAAAPQRKSDLADWFYLPTWRPSTTPASDAEDEPERWLIFADACGLGDAVIRVLEGRGVPFAVVSVGDAFTPLEDGSFVLRADAREDYDRLLDAAAKHLGGAPNHLLHLWGVDATEPHAEQAEEPCPAQLAQGFWSLLYTAQALARRGEKGDTKLAVAATHVRKVLETDPAPRPFKAAILGPVKVLPREHETLHTVAIDVPAATVTEAGERDRLATRLVAETRGAARGELAAYRGPRRLSLGFAAAPFPPVSTEALPLKQGGTYVITGGLGGFGLTFAEHLATRYGARLVLTGRTAPHPPEEWDAYLESHGDDDRVAGMIRNLLELEAAGAEVLPLQADAVDAERMVAVLAEARQRFGRIDGVIHAAGVAGGGMAQLKQTETAARVLAPKCQGTEALLAALGTEAPDFLMLCSSITSILGIVGQIDYCAANNVLDAYAEAYADRHPDCRSVSVNWGGWQDVGMAVDPRLEAAGKPARSDEQPLDIPASPIHPLLHRVEHGEDGTVTFFSDLGIERHWALDEHRIAGRGALPGTTYMELARAAHSHLTGEPIAEIHDLFFLSPLMVAEGEHRRMRLVLEPAGDRRRFRIESRPLGGSPDAWQEHARGGVGSVTGPRPKDVDLDGLRSRCGRHLDLTGKTPSEGESNRLVSWGPRWRSIQAASLGEDEGIAELELPAAFTDDLESHPLHPALLDVATALLSSVGGGDEFLPLSYGSLSVYEPLTPRLLSHLRTQGAGGETVSGDISLLDSSGRVLVEIERFTMKRVGQAAKRLESKGPQPGGASQPRVARETARQSARVPDRMKPAEGVEAFERLLAMPGWAQVVVWPTDLEARLRQLAAGASMAQSSRSATPGEGSRHARPDLGNDYTAPEGEVEEALATIWQQILGLEEVGVDDNFFELGGDSLMGIQVISMAAEHGITLLPEQLFEHQTIAELAALASAVEDGEAAPEPAAEPGAELDADDAGLSEDEMASVLSQLGEPS